MRLVQFYNLISACCWMSGLGLVRIACTTSGKRLIGIRMLEGEYLSLKENLTDGDSVHAEK